MADINAVAEAFVKFYYQTFDSNRAGLSNLYVSYRYILPKNVSLLIQP